MSEKEIKNNDLAGKKIEDLTEEELNQLQGQGGDVNEETTILTITTVTAAALITKKVVCKK